MGRALRPTWRCPLRSTMLRRRRPGWRRTTPFVVLTFNRCKQGEEYERPERDLKNISTASNKIHRELQANGAACGDRP